MPAIHNRMYGQLDDWRLPNRVFRVFIEPRAVASGGQHLLDLDALRVFLDGFNAPCSIQFVTRGTLIEVRTEFAGVTGVIDVYTGPIGPSVAQRVERVLGEQRQALGSSYVAIEAGCQARADVVVPATVPTEPSGYTLRRTLDLAVCDWSDAKRECEVFCRGHDVPWSYAARTWGMPFQGFYSFAEPPEVLRRLHAAAVEKSLAPGTLELVRSLTLNRVPALAFTRDRLLYYQQQRCHALRHGTRRSESGFELDYYLNHYYLLLWGGLDQLCWIMNGVLNLGIGDDEFFKLGIAKDTFLRLVKQSSPEVHAVLTDTKFVTWCKIIAGARHHAAHRGITLASELYFTDGEEPSIEALDEEIASDPEWVDTAKILGAEVAEQFRGTFRLQAKIRRLEKDPERVMQIRVDKMPALITPLVNVQYDYETFLRTANQVATLLTSKLGQVSAGGGGNAEAR